MYLVEGVVLYRNLPNPLLSFRSSHPYREGDIIRAPLRNGEVFLFVLSSQSIVERKLDIKHVTFQLKPLPKQEPLAHFSEKLLKTSISFAQKNDVPLHTLLSQKILERFIPELSYWTPESTTQKHEVRPITSLVSDLLESDQSAVVICPSVLFLRTFFETLSGEIEPDHTTLTTWYGGSTAGEKKLREQYLSGNLEGQTIILTTSSFIPFIPEHTHAILVEPANLYHHDSEYNFSHAAWLLETTGVPVTCYGLTKKMSTYISSLPVTMLERKQKPSATYVSEVEALLPKKMLGMMSKDIKQKRRIGIFSLQTGYSSAIFCTTCKKIARCLTCDHKLSKHVEKKNIQYVCHAGSHRFDPWDTCQYCGALSLIELGTGTEQLEEFLIEYFPKQSSSIVRIDSFKAHADSLSPKKITGLIQEFSNNGRILIGSIKAFLSTATSFDSIYILDYDQLIYTSSNTFNRSLVLAHLMPKTKELVLVCDDTTIAPEIKDVFSEALLSQDPIANTP